jgi:hypothetical protein
MVKSLLTGRTGRVVLLFEVVASDAGPIANSDDICTAASVFAADNGDAGREASDERCEEH